jgi:hypothetical protein
MRETVDLYSGSEEQRLHQYLYQQSNTLPSQSLAPSFELTPAMDNKELTRVLPNLYNWQNVERNWM